MNNDWFNAENEIDEEAEMELYRVLFKLNEKYESQDFIAVPKKVEEVLGVYKSLKANLEKECVKVSLDLFDTCKYRGDILVSGGTYCFAGTKAVIEAMRKADMVDVVPKTDGSVDIYFSFFNVAVPVKKEVKI